jgi:glycosyltransferase involved in cell wall biosynthesis
LIAPIKTFDGVYVQAWALKKALEDLGLKNVYYMPNCRDYQPIDPPNHFAERPLRICTYSRIVKTKGLTDAMEICELANQKLGETRFVLDIYGKVAPEFQAEFEAACEAHRAVVHYCGVKNADETTTVMRDYFAVLFPTYYEGECFAGTALDAFSARIPIIANDWKYNREAIRDGVDGFIYPFRDNNAAAERLVQLSDSPELYRTMQAECAQSAQRYSTEAVMSEFVKRLD